MRHPIISRKRAKTLSSALFLIGLAILAFIGWWPGILLAVGLPLALRQFLLGAHYDVVVTLLVFGGGFLTLEFAIPWDFFLPTVFILGAIYILTREFFESRTESEEEQEEDANREIEEEKKR